MARSRSKRDLIATLLSCAAFAAALMGTSPVLAEDTLDALDARHRLGLQVGGSSVFQILYRLRLLGHSYLDVGSAGLPGGPLNASAGLVVAFATGTRLFPYASAGVGFAGVGGPAPANDAQTNACADGASGCPWRSTLIGYGYARGGLGFAVGRQHRGSLYVDVGLWRGEKTRSFDDGAGLSTSSSRRFLWPMGGLAYLFAF